MLDSILLNSSGNIVLTPVMVMVCSAISIALGLVIAVVYMICSQRYTKDYVVTLVILPILVQVVIMMVNGNLGAGVAVMGAFSLVRFRSIPGSAREIGIIFFAMATGLATGMGYIGFAAIVTAVVSVVLIVLEKVNLGSGKMAVKSLKITIPEDMDFTEIFDDIFEKYTKYTEVENIKTSNLGSLFTITYSVEMKRNVNEKAMIDEIRCRNGNLTISLSRNIAAQEL